MKKKIGFASLIIGASVVATGCHSQLSFSTPSGMREYGRYRNGGLSISKSSPDRKDNYHATQDVYEKNKTHRKMGAIQDAIENWGNDVGTKMGGFEK